jgi:DNA-binding NarL/FixJ family response regulator
MASVDESSRINFAQVRILLLDDHTVGSGILIQIVRAFGANNIVHCTSIAEAKKSVEEHEFHLVLINSNLRESGVYDFIHWLRRYDVPPNCFASVVLIAGHTPRSNVERARDAGANVIMAKPVSPLSVLERLMWTAREKRNYVKCATYVGPDRRFQNLGPPPDLSGRRLDDQTAPDEPVTGGPQNIASRFA